MCQKNWTSEKSSFAISKEKEDVLIEFFLVLMAVRRLARELEADRNVTLSRAPQQRHEIHDKLHVMA